MRRAAGIAALALLAALAMLYVRRYGLPPVVLSALSTVTRDRAR